MFYVYVLQNTEGKLYFGYSKDLRRRIAEHQRRSVPSTAHGSWRLVYYEAYESEEDARIREQRLKDGRAQVHLRNRLQNSLLRKIK